MRGAAEREGRVEKLERGRLHVRAIPTVRIVVKRYVAVKGYDPLRRRRMVQHVHEGWHRRTELQRQHRHREEGPREQRVFLADARGPESEARWIANKNEGPSCKCDPERDRAPESERAEHVAPHISSDPKARRAREDRIANFDRRVEAQQQSADYSRSERPKDPDLKGGQGRQRDERPYCAPYIEPLELIGKVAQPIASERGDEREPRPRRRPLPNRSFVRPRAVTLQAIVLLSSRA